MSAAALEVRGLEKRFGHAVALAGLDLELAPGHCLAVLGPNGAGKSTLLRLVAGLTRPSAGSLRIGGREAHRREARARVGFIGHASLLYPALTARENLIFSGRLHGVADPAGRAQALLEEERLGAVADRPLAGFSRGMSQRVAIARGLVHDPELLLLDEPFTGLDHGAAARLVQRLAALRESGHSLVLVTHDVARAAQLADSALVLSGGRVSQLFSTRPDPAALEQAAMAASQGPA